MRSLLKLFVVLMICLAAIGLYRGWFSFSSSQAPDTGGNKVNIGVAVDKDKMIADVARAKERLKGEVKELEGKAKSKETK